MKRFFTILLLLLFGFSFKSFAISLTLESPVFASNTSIPSQYTCTGADVSPPLVWHDSSFSTQSYVLIVDDPDAPGGVWNHWVLVNISPNIKQLAEGAKLPAGAINGKNSWGSFGYRGPCPPSGAHRYFFRLYALDMVLKVSEPVTKNEITELMKGHIIASSELIGLYQKK